MEFLKIFSIPSFVVGVLFMGILVYAFHLRRKAVEAKDKDRFNRTENNLSERRLKKAAIQQTTMGEAIFHWFEDNLKEYIPFGLHVTKLVNNGGDYTIFVDRRESGGVLPIPLAQISVNFVEGFRGSTSLNGHVHIAAYGEDFYFQIIDHAPLHNLKGRVFDYIHEEMERVKKRSEQSA